MTLLAAFQTLLHRYSGQTDIVIGSPVAGRNRKELEELVGFFLNTLVLRLDLSGNPTFAETIRRVREVCLGALSHQELPFEKLVEELHPARNLGHNPLFQVSFAFQNTPRFSPQLSTINVDELAVETGIARFDLHLFMEEIDGCLKGYCDYDTNLFNAETIEKMVGHFQTLLAGIVRNPQQRISDLPLLTDSEKHQLLVEWNNTKTDYPKEKCIHELFETQVEKSPDVIAVAFEDQELTYQELNRRANQLAHYLRKRGVGSESLVGICVERSLNMIVAILGVLKAGGAYVPLDPAYPKERLSFMLEDTQVRVVLTEVTSLPNLPSTSARVICLDPDCEEVAREPQDNLINQSTADSLAYVIYTSGSTGVPKGVEVCHRGVVRLLFGVDYVRFDGMQTFFHLAPISFDAATFEVWGALLHGGKCVLCPGKAPSPRELGEVLKKYRVHTLWLTAALFNTVIDQEPQALSEVKQLLIGGEALSAPHVRKGLARLPDAEIINGYGPTESTTFTCCYPIARPLADNLSSIPIGRPIANTQVYILDPHGYPTPVGVPGEIYIGGAGLARGYLNHPELTAEKFIANPFSAKPGARLYRSGDIARYLPDGNIELIGRKDDQVKIRGYRIEPGEIEAVLNRHPQVRDVVVVAREDCPGDKRLVAYVAGHDHEELKVDELKTFLKTEVPGYMMPSAWVNLVSLPRTPNGKINRAALPAPDAGQLDSSAKFTAPRTEVEKTLARVWAEVLKLERVGIHDNFFDLGGHSLLATQVLSRLRNDFSKEIPLRTLFESPTIEQMAAVIMEDQEKQLGEEELEYMQGELESLPDEGVQPLLAEETVSTTEAKRHE
jgi:aspartate racemase